MAPERRRRRAPRRRLQPSRCRELEAQRAAEKAEPLTLRPFALAMPRALLIGSSTGGPQALTALIEKLDRRGRARAGADHPAHAADFHHGAGRASAARQRPRRAEAEDGEPVLAGGIYVAPGGRHMRVVRDGDGVRIALGDDPPINFCKPAVDPLFSSAAAVWGAGSARARSHRHGHRRHAAAPPILSPPAAA